MLDEEKEVDAPVASVGLGEAEATIIEPGATDASSETEIINDEHVEVHIEVPPAAEPDSPSAEDHEHEHHHISECPECMAAVEQAAVRHMDAQLAAAIAEIEAAEPEPTPEPEPEPTPEPDVPPQREGRFARLWYRGMVRDEV